MRLYAKQLKLLTASFLLAIAFSGLEAHPLRSEPLPLAQTAEAAEAVPAELVDEVWQIVNQNYIDTTFNGHDWESVRQKYISHTYNSLDEAYAAIQDMLALLGDRFTRFMDPQAFGLMQADPEGNTGSIGLQIRQDEMSEEIVVANAIEETPALQDNQRAMLVGTQKMLIRDRAVGTLADPQYARAIELLQEM